MTMESAAASSNRVRRSSLVLRGKFSIIESPPPPLNLQLAAFHGGREG
jgi:hypothetical protein